MSESLRLMAVHAHPDDESSKGAAMMAKYVADGAEVLVVTCTGGERGDILNPSFDLGARDIATVRRDEMARAAQILGAVRAAQVPDQLLVAAVTRIQVPSVRQ